jgi:UDP-N-acetylmuramate dehydrogenase
MNDQQRQHLASLCRSVVWKANMAAHSTFRAGGVVDALVEIGAEQELSALLQWLAQEDIPWHVIGGCSNILVATPRHRGVFIRLRSSVQDVALVEETKRDANQVFVRIPAGCSLAAVVGWCTRNGLAGLSFMAGIPGSIGGAVRMNAGAFGHSIGERICSVRCMTSRGEIREIPRNEVAFGYRSTQLPGEHSTKRALITAVVLALEPGDRQQITDQCRQIVSRRQQKQPRGVASAGSFFKNPDGDFAGRLIENAGLKGLAQGKAMVSPKHANFIVNTGGAEPEDIVLLMEKVRQVVLQQSGVLLEPEVHIL